MSEDPKPRPMTGFFATLSPEQQKAALAYTGDDNLGDPEFLLAPKTSSPNGTPGSAA